MRELKTMRALLCGWLCVCVSLGCFGVACSNSSSGSSGSSGTDDPGAAAGGSAISALQQAITVTDSVFQFDPDLAPARTAQDNANTMESRTRGSVAACPNTKVTVTLTRIVVDFGPPPGCTLASGATVSGALEASVSGGGGGGLRDGGGDVIRDGGPDLVDGGGSPLTVTMKFTKLVVNAQPLDGTIAFSTTNGSTFNVAITSLTTSAGTLGGTVTVVGAPGSVNVDGNLSLTVGGGTVSIALAGVVMKQGDCYPSSGTETTTLLGVKTVGTFDANTASTGTYTKQTGERKPETAALAPYGACPPGPPGPGDAARGG